MPDLFLELRDESGGGEQTPEPLPEDDALDLLRNAEFSASRLIPWGVELLVRRGPRSG